MNRVRVVGARVRIRVQVSRVGVSRVRLGVGLVGLEGKNMDLL